ncbi:hypothetical protein [Glaciimonas sp. PCH181]|uniref:hypothetical protein n=1 Tax=Glaciimonas sp. PCH181 TaxID=2133943 RepID=UPI000D3BA57B|nr:hypothetical protein [Glaciimonas sp. PCH181]PUA17252.1 hypothetical protein C7W93_15075 [Glaciimonas sp. PCH181]
MDAEFQRLLMFSIEGLLSAFSTVIWFSYRDQKAKNEATQRALDEYKLHVAESYVTQNVLSKAVEGIAKSLESFSQSMDKKLDRIEYKLDGKQDKGQS